MLLHAYDDLDSVVSEVSEDVETSDTEHPDAADQEDDQEASEDPEAAGQEIKEGDKDGDLSAGDGSGTASADGMDASESGRSDTGDPEESGLEEASSDLDSVSEDNSDAVLDFDPEYYISDGVLYTPDGVALDRDVYILPASVTASNAVYTPTAWQVNLAENRKFGEHYLMWAQRVYSGSSYYWRYYLALGRDMSYASNVYTYVDAEIYSYYSYNSLVTYDVSVSSGTVSGSTYLVYSDLYFDYVGTDPAASGLVYVVFFMFVLLFAVLMRRRM